MAMREIYETADALVSRGAHRIRLFDSLEEGCGLDLPLNDPDTGDTLRVAELSVEDSGFGPALWRLALALVQERANLLQHRQAAERATIRAQAVLQPGDVVLRRICGGATGRFTFTGWNGIWACGKTVDDCHAINIIKVNGEVVSFADASAEGGAA